MPTRRYRHIDRPDERDRLREAAEAARARREAWMSGQPDPKPERAERRAGRVRDPLTVLQAKLADRECWGCGKEGADGHHLVPKDWAKPGPDLAWNIIALCGSGTSGCHGAYHGTPYVTPGGDRIDQRAVGRKIGHRLLYWKPDEWRMQELLAFLDAPELVVRFFLRQLHTEVERRAA